MVTYTVTWGGGYHLLPLASPAQESLANVGGTEMATAGDEGRPLARNLVLLMAFETGLVLWRRCPQAHGALLQPISTQNQNKLYQFCLSSLCMETHNFPRQAILLPDVTVCR